MAVEHGRCFREPCASVKRRAQAVQRSTHNELTTASPQKPVFRSAEALKAKSSDTLRDQFRDEEQMRAVQSQYFGGLTGLRGLGAIWVMSFHASVGASQIVIIDHGYLAVDLFFILSGFILSHAHRDYAFTAAAYATFIRDRVARLFPLHWAGLALTAVVLALTPAIQQGMPNRFGVVQLGLNLLLMQNWLYAGPTSWNPPAWSLSTEWLVSLGFPLFLWSARRFHQRWLTLAACAGCIGAYGLFVIATHNPTLDLPGHAGIVRTICEFMAGCLLYQLYRQQVRVPTVGLLAILALFAVGFSAPSRGLFAVMAFPLVVLMTAQGSVLSRLFAWRPIAFLGEISFSIYVLHWIVLQAFDYTAIGTLRDGAWWPAFVVLYLGLVIGLSTISYRVVERPSRQWIKRLRLTGDPAVDPAAVPATVSPPRSRAVRQG